MKIRFAVADDGHGNYEVYGSRSETDEEMREQVEEQAAYLLKIAEGRKLTVWIMETEIDP